MKRRRHDRPEEVDAGALDAMAAELEPHLEALLGSGGGARIGPDGKLRAVVLLLGDGASWIWNLGDEFFRVPEAEAWERAAPSTSASSTGITRSSTCGRSRN